MSQKILQKFGKDYSFIRRILAFSFIFFSIFTFGIYLSVSNIAYHPGVLKFLNCSNFGFQPTIEVYQSQRNLQLKPYNNPIFEQTEGPSQQRYKYILFWNKFHTWQDHKILQNILNFKIGIFISSLNFFQTAESTLAI